MDIPQVLAVLRPGEDWGPCAQSDSTYTALAATWRGSSAVPTEAEMLVTWDTIQANAAMVAAQARRAAAVGLVMTSEEPRDVALRGFLRDIYTAINDLRQALPTPLPRVLEPDILTRVVTGLNNSQGDVAPPE